jgi:tetratricopeptide (TPR) repeat protein
MKIFSVGAAVLFSIGIFSQLFSSEWQSPVLAQENSSTKAEAERLRQQGNDAIDRNQPTVALPLFQKALTLYQSISDRLGEGLALNSIGAVHYYDFGDMETGQRYFTKTLQMAQMFSLPEVEVKALINLGHIERNTGRTQQAINYHRKSLAIAQKNANCYQEALALENLGYDVLLSRGPLETNRYLEQGVAALDKCSSTPPLSKLTHQKKAIDLLNIIGLNYFTQHTSALFKPVAPTAPTSILQTDCALPSTLKQGISAYQKASTLAQQINEPTKAGQAFLGMGKIYQFQSCFQEAQTVLLKAQSFLEKSPSAKLELGTTLLFLSLVYRQDKSLLKSLQASQAALNVFRGQAASPNNQLEHRKYEAQSLSVMGDIYAALSNSAQTTPPKEPKGYPEKSLAAYAESIRIAKSALLFADTLLNPQKKVNNDWINIQKKAIQTGLQNTCLQGAALYDRLGQSGKLPSGCESVTKP